MGDGEHRRASPWTLERIRALRDSRAARDEHGLALIEGARFVVRARHQGFAIVGLVIAPDLIDTAGARRCRRELSERVPVSLLSEEEFRGLSTMEEPTGLMAIVRQRWVGLPTQRPKRGRLWLAAESIRSPGNLGTILRTAEAAGAAGLICLGPGIDPYQPRVIRASMGSIFGMRTVRATAEQLHAFKRCTGATVVGATAEARRDYRRGRYGPATVLMLGSERKGLSPRQRRLCDQLVRIPMAGATDSLNVASATSILLYESYRQRWPLG